MVSRAFSVEAALLPALGASLLLASTLVAIAGEGRKGLGKDVLASSRGGSPNLVASSSPCDLPNNLPCPTMDGTCTTCDFTHFIQMVSGSNGWLNQNQWSPGACGANLSGTCSGSTCVPFYPSQITSYCVGKPLPPQQPQ